MNEIDTTFRIRRILVALDSSPHSLAALEAAVDLAARMEAQLAGLFVEDVELLRMADAPFARELLYPAAKEAPMNRAAMEHKLRAQSEQARKALATAADRAQVQWTFRTVRGQVTSEVLAAAGDADLLAIGKKGWSLRTRVKIGSTALELAIGGSTVLLLSAHRAFANLPLLVYYDGSPAARRALLAAAKLAGSGKKRMTVLVTASRESFPAIQKEAGARLEDQDVEIRYHRIDASDESGLLDALREEGGGVLVLGARELLANLPVEAFLRESEMPVLLLGHGSARSG
jgi:nucleotide-binding universal stress UspA family protein